MKPCPVKILGSEQPAVARLERSCRLRPTAPPGMRAQPNGPVISSLASLGPQEGLGECFESSFIADKGNWKSCVIASLLHDTTCLTLLRLLDARVRTSISPPSSEIPFTGLWFIFQGYSCTTRSMRETRLFKVLKILMSQTEKCSAFLISTQLKSTRRRERQQPLHSSGNTGFHCHRDHGTPLWNQWKSILPRSDRLLWDLSRIFLQIANWMRVLEIMKALDSMHVNFLVYFLCHCGSNKEKWRRSEVICGLSTGASALGEAGLGRTGGVGELGVPPGTGLGGRDFLLESFWRSTLARYFLPFL